MFIRFQLPVVSGSGMNCVIFKLFVESRSITLVCIKNTQQHV